MAIRLEDAKVIFDENDHAIGMIWLTANHKYRVKACIGTPTMLLDTYEQVLDWFEASTEYGD